MYGSGSGIRDGGMRIRVHSTSVCPTIPGASTAPPHTASAGLGLGVQGLGFRVQDLGFGVNSVGFRVQGLGLRV